RHDRFDQRTQIEPGRRCTVNPVVGKGIAVPAAVRDLDDGPAVRRPGREEVVAVGAHFSGRPILTAELCQHGAVIDADQEIFDAGWRLIAAGWPALRAAPGESVILRWRSGVGNDTHRSLPLAADEAAMLIGNAGLRMHGSRLQHIEGDENEGKYPNAVHAAILPAMRE